MGIELLSAFIFGIMILSCFKPLRSSYTGHQLAQEKVITKQRYAEKKAFNEEMNSIAAGFEVKFAQALKGELKK